MPVNSIEIDFKRALNYAVLLEKIASDIDSIRNNELVIVEQSLNYGWGGEHAKEYMKKIKHLPEHIKWTKGELIKISNLITLAAIAIYGAEMVAVKIAKKD